MKEKISQILLVTYLLLTLSITYVLGYRVGVMSGCGDQLEQVTETIISEIRENQAKPFVYQAAEGEIVDTTQLIEPIMMGTPSLSQYLAMRGEPTATPIPTATPLMSHEYLESSPAGELFQLYLRTDQYDPTGGLTNE